MDLITREDLSRLVNTRDEAALSLTMPTHRDWEGERQDPIRYKNLLEKAETQLQEAGLDRAEIGKRLKPLREKLEEQRFWQYLSDGLAIYVSSDGIELYRLPLELDEVVMVSDRFYLKPILPLFTENGQFYILALSKNETRLLQATRTTVDQVELPNIPESLSDAVVMDLQPEGSQFHTRAPSAGARGRTAVFHGHSAEHDEKDKIAKYFSQIDRGLREVLTDENIPMILAGVDYLLPIYRRVSKYANLLNEEITGNPEQLRNEQLHEKAWEQIRPLITHKREQHREQFNDLTGTGRTVDTVEQALPAAVAGRIDKLFVARNQYVWGRYNGEENRVQITGEQAKGMEDLLDACAVHTLLKGGIVHVVDQSEIPGGALLAAVLRY